MQPDILAKPSERTSGGPDQAPGTDHSVRNRPVETMTASASSDCVSVTTPPILPAANGHVHGYSNGHAASLPHRTGHLNGHSNGLANGHVNGHSRAGIALLGASGALEQASPVRAPAEGFYLRAGKRIVDLVGALVALVLAAPLLLLAAIMIKLESRGPVVYRSTRIGRNGRAFTFFKLRSMVNDADQMRHHVAHLNECDGPVFKISRDPRVTRVGRFLRRSSIDEIPQFINVLRGEMSLVGPRPPIPDEVAKYEPWQMHRLDIAPGITCLWQISGRSRIGFQEWMRLDLEYIRNRSLAMDVKILLRTIPAVLSREGAY